MSGMWRDVTGTAGKIGVTGCGRDCRGCSPAPRSTTTSDIVKTADRWYSGRLQQEVTVVRWGSYGRPVLVFPSAGGDAEETERMGLVGACAGLLAAGRVK